MLPLCLFRMTVFLVLRYRKAFQKADILILPQELNFCTSVMAPDIAARNYPDRHIVFVTFDYERTNKYVECIWDNTDDIEYVLIPNSYLSFTLFGKRIVIPSDEVLERYGGRMVAFIAGCLGSPQEIYTSRGWLGNVGLPPQCWEDLHKALSGAVKPEWADYWEPSAYFAVYYHLKFEVCRPAPSLPRNLLNKVEAALLKARPDCRSFRSCGLYLKKGKMTISDNDPHIFDGSPFTNYLPAVRLLNERGYQVFLTGDRSLPEEVHKEFDGMFVNGESLGVDPMLFNVYAALHTDIFVGDNAGGMGFAGLIDSRPMLALNTYHFFSSFSNIWIYYKHAYHRDGRHLSFEEMTGKYAYTPAADRLLHVEVNSAEEIREAVGFYLDEIENPGSSEIDESLENLWPSYSMFKLGRSHISPAYVRNYYQKISQTSAHPLAPR